MDTTLRMCKTSHKILTLMKKIKFTQEQKMLHHLILHSHDVPTGWGLFNGMTGIMLVLAHYAKVRSMPDVE